MHKLLDMFEILGGWETFCRMSSHMSFWGAIINAVCIRKPFAYRALFVHAYWNTVCTQRKIRKLILRAQPSVLCRAQLDPPTVPWAYVDPRPKCGFRMHFENCCLCGRWNSWHQIVVNHFKFDMQTGEMCLPQVLRLNLYISMCSVLDGSMR